VSLCDLLNLRNLFTTHCYIYLSGLEKTVSATRHLYIFHQIWAAWSSKKRKKTLQVQNMRVHAVSQENNETSTENEWAKAKHISDTQLSCMSRSSWQTLAAASTHNLLATRTTMRGTSLYVKRLKLIIVKYKPSLYEHHMNCLPDSVFYRQIVGKDRW
jgi:hypothetical protein